MRYFAVMVAVLAALTGFAGTAHAQGAPPCVWTVQGAERSDATVVEGENIVVQATVLNSGTFKVPDGWTGDAYKAFPAGQCLWGPQFNCGTWEATKTAAVADNGPATFTVEGAGCSPASQSFNITVKPKVAETPTRDPYEATWTQDEKSETLEHVRKAEGQFGNVEVAVGFLTVPNMPETTRWGRGFQASAGGKPVRTEDGILGLKLDAAFKIWSTGAPINPELRPMNMDVDMLVHTEELRTFFDICPLHWLQLDIGLGLGVMTESWDQEIIRQESNGGSVTVSENKTETVATVNPTLEGTVVFDRYVGVQLQGWWTQPLEGRMATAGSQDESAAGFPGGSILLVGQF